MNRISIIDRDSIEGIKLIVKSVIYEDFMKLFHSI